MSSPPNKLARFRSYSYYHVLAMCDCSATADALSKSNDLDAWNHATPDTRVVDDRRGVNDLGPYAPKKVSGSGNYIVLINGSTDAAFVINTARWTSMTAGDAVPGDRSTSIAVEGSIQISEPKGIVFLDQVVKCSIALGIDSSQVVYVLKTFFVGFGVDDYGAEFVDHMTNVPPITLLVVDVTGQFTEAGGAYDMQFVAAGHGGARLPQYGKAVNAMSITAGASLQSTIQALQDQVNQNYDKYFQCVLDQMNAITDIDVRTSMVNSLRRVKYVITVGSVYKEVAGGTKYTVTNQAQQFKNTAGCADSAQLTFPAHSSIEQAIATIMSMSPEVQREAGRGDSSTNVKYEYKIHTAVASAPVAGSDQTQLEQTIYYRVDRILTPKTISYSPGFEVLALDDADAKKDPMYDALRRNIIEFDYIYTGKNIDILEFDMKLNLGLAYLQTATLANTFKSQLERGPNRTMQASTGDANTFNTRFDGKPVQTFVYFGSQIKTPALTNTQDAARAIQSMYTMNKHASLEVSDVSMKIIGNEQLLGTNKITSPEYVIASADRDTFAATQTPDDSSFADWSHIPAFAKVNIKMPRSNDDLALFTGQSGTGNPNADPTSVDYARNFWFDGYYYVYAIEHIFDGGTFTQELKMLGIPKKSATNAAGAGAGAPAKEADITSAVGSCFDNQIACGNAAANYSNEGRNATSPAVAVHALPPAAAAGAPVAGAPPATSTAPTNKIDADSVNKGNKSVSNVKGWDAPFAGISASADVKAAIIDAANKTGADLVTLAQFACHESRFNPTAIPINRKTGKVISSAAGLYQFLGATWNDLVKGGKIPGLTAATGVVPVGHNGPLQPASNDVRFTPAYNALAGAAYLVSNAAAIGSSATGDLYLAHFAGPPTARKIIAADNASGPNTSLVSVLGPDGTQSLVTGSGSKITANGTTGQARAFAAASMAETLIDGIPIVGNTTTKRTPAGQTQVSSNPATAKRPASDAIGAVQNCDVQAAKTTTNPCGPTPSTASSAPQDKATPPAPATAAVAASTAAGAPQPTARK